MDRGLQALLEDPRIRRAWSLSLGGVLEGLAQIAPPLLTFYLVGFRIVEDGLGIVALALVLAVPMYLVVRARSGRTAPALKKALVVAVINLCAAGVGLLIHALPNFFFA
jgi:cytochrome c oxidase assembly factor CtaG